MSEKTSDGRSRSSTDAPHSCELIEKRTLSRSLTQPKGTIEYVVGSTDTLSCIAARFETTPSELTKLNRLTTRMLFPGQILYVPKRGGNSGEKHMITPTNSPIDKVPSDSCEFSPKPGHVKRVVSPDNSESHFTAPTSTDKEQNITSPHPSSTKIDPADRECLERFLKINARHITDGQGVVNGVLLVTPNAIMFDPNVSDPLVIEHGAEYYGVTVPMEMILKTAMYSDIAHMRVKHAPESVPSAPRPEVYYASGDLEDDSFVLQFNESLQSATLKEDIIRDDIPINFESETGSFVNDKTDEIPSQTVQDSVSLDETKPENGDEIVAINKDGGGGGDESHVSVESIKHVQQSDETEDIDKSENSHIKHNKIDGKSEENDDIEENSDVLTEDFQKSPVSFANDAESTNQFVNNEKILAKDNENIGKVALSIRHSMPETRERKANLMPAHLTANSADDTNDKKRSPQGETRREQMIKRLQNPVESISNYTISGISSGINATKSGLMSGINTTKSGISSGINATKSGISSGYNATKSGISSGLNVTKSGLNRVISAPKNIVEFSSGLVRDAKDVLSVGSSKSDSFESEKDTVKETTFTVHKDQHFDNRGIYNRQSSGFGYTNVSDTSIDVFANFEKLIPRPARSCEDPPLYLCLRMGRPSNKKLQKFSPAIISFGRKKIEREYWFSIPKEKADNLYHFFHRWAPEIYGDVDNLQGCDERGLTAIDTDEEEEEDGDVFETETTQTTSVDGNDDNREAEKSRPRFWRRRGPLNFLKLVEGRFAADGVSPEWEVVSTADVRRTSFDFMNEPILPELIGASEILNDDYRKKLCKHLPARAEGYSWKLIYSSSKHGFSLNTLYREMTKYDTPVLLGILDNFGKVFGALTSSPLRMSDHFFGTGETFLFTFHPDFQCFPWTGENLYFIKGNTDSISIGAGDGNFGLWLDGDIFHGRNHPCKTFGNSMLTVQEDFVVKALECWGFV